ncbi:hypothetical protein Aperf_G00000051386 [Anoplocephala perfoliata]
MISDDYLPAWAEVKVVMRPSFVSLILYLIFGQAFGGSILFWWFRNLYISFHVFLSTAIVYLWLYTTVGEVVVLMSYTLGVQCSCRYLSGRWCRSPLIPIHRIRAVHLLDRVTSTSVSPHLFLELRSLTYNIPKETVSNSNINSVPPPPTASVATASCFITSASVVTDETINAMLQLRPLFSVPIDEEDTALPPLCCLPLQSLVTVYRLAQAILFRETVPCAF